MVLSRQGAWCSPSFDRLGTDWVCATRLTAAKEEGAYPAVYVAATLDGVTGYYRSDDEGATWVQIDDAKHGFGAPGSNVLTGDPRVYGRCVQDFLKGEGVNVLLTW